MFYFYNTRNRDANFQRETIDIIWKRSNFVRGLLQG